MVTFNSSGRLLVTLFDLTQTGATIDLFSLSAGAGLNLYCTLSELDSLAKRGLVDARRLRLTASGLAVAVSLDRRARSASASAAPKASGVLHLLSRAAREQRERPEQQLFNRDLVA